DGPTACGLRGTARLHAQVHHGPLRRLSPGQQQAGAGDDEGPRGVTQLQHRLVRRRTGRTGAKAREEKGKPTGQREKVEGEMTAQPLALRVHSRLAWLLVTSPLHPAYPGA